ncbi:MAG: 2-hexaprenyl-6-methoxy-1,4-benzoquinone methyltransferase, variant 2 [Marteilia pararefringens]
MNDLMSLGLHRWWKRDFVRQLAINDGIRICDMAGGTGDISAQILSMNPDTDLRIDICDLSSEMIERGKENLKSNKINWHCCNAEKLPFEDSSFDIYTIAFGIRNVTNMNKVLKECNRVLKPNGRFVCLEFSNVDNLLLNNLYRYYSFKIIPIIGYLVAGDWDAYQYLVESIEKFPKKELFTEIIRENNFENVEYNSLNGGIVCIHSGYKV